MSHVFGFDQSRRLVHVSQVPRGLSCDCRCVECEEPLIARQGSVREHHFAHASGREPCNSNHESLLHRYAKQCIVEAGGLLVPANAAAELALGLEIQQGRENLLVLPLIDVEPTIKDVRPDLVGFSEAGVGLAIEVAYSSFCDPEKIRRLAGLGLPAIEIDLSAFMSENFDPKAVMEAVVYSIDGKTWLHPKPPPAVDRSGDGAPSPQPPMQLQGDASASARMTEEVLLIADRMVSIRELPSGDIAVRTISYDPNLTKLISAIAKSYAGRYQPQWRSWCIPKRWSQVARSELREKSRTVSIWMSDASE